jgi:death on curing protein
MHGIVNLGLVESAIHRPYNGYYRRIERKAAALVESVAGNHGFADGNKRTTLILVHTLLTKSGYRLVPARDSEAIDRAVEEMILSSVTKTMSLDDIVIWFNRRIRSA